MTWHHTIFIDDKQYVYTRDHRLREFEFNVDLRGVEWAIFVWIMPESCAFRRFFALRGRLEIAMILDGEN